MTRVGTFASHAAHTTNMLQLQKRVFDSNQQVTSEKKSQSYAGYGAESNRLINLENELSATERFMTNNKITQTQLSVTQTTLDAVEKTIRDFRERLNEFGAGTKTGVAEVQDIQRWAFHALTEMESYLNTNIDGQYAFAGGKVSQAPVDIGFASWEDFKATYDGSATTFPTDRDSHLALYFQGDTMELTRQLDGDQQITVGVTAAHTSFEKAMRAMAIIAQGDFGTAGGLENNLGRVEDARWLLNDALQSPPSGTPPYGPELSGDLKTVSRMVSMNQVVLKDKLAEQKEYADFLTNRASDIENVDPTEAILRMMDDSRALEVSYSALSHISKLSLADYLR